MNTGENIRNAAIVLLKTYENVYKMMADCRRIAIEAGYKTVTDKFLRWKSDGDPSGWLIKSFVMLFQKQTDDELANGWRKGSVFGVEIVILDKNNMDKNPEVLLTRFDYNNLEEWYSGCSPADHWGFHQPINSGFVRDFLCEDFEWYKVSKPKTEKIADTYWGLIQAITTSCPLTDITSDNLKATIFDTFDKLDKL